LTWAYSRKTIEIAERKNKEAHGKIEKELVKVTKGKRERQRTHRSERNTERENWAAQWRHVRGGSSTVIC